MKHSREHDAHRAFEESTLHAGCNGDCEWGQDCNCSHKALRPRQPRRPEPRRPHLPLSTRARLIDWSHWGMMALLAFSIVGGLYAVSELIALAWP